MRTGVRPESAVANPERGGGRPPVVLDVAVFAVIVVLALLTLFLPYTGDQALFARAAREIGRGAIYYRDFWDIKQPGIYWWFTGAGAIAGYGAAAIHVVELVYLLAFAVVLRVAVRGRFTHAVLEPFVPLLAVGGYYVVAEAIDRTMVEVLAGFPIFVCLYLALRAAERPQRSALLLFGSGLAAGLAMLFKLEFGLIVVAFWVVAFVQLRRGGRSTNAALRDVGAAVVGALVPLAVALVYFAAHHTTRIVYDTTIVYPPKVARTGDMHNSALLRTLVRLTVLDYAPVIFLAAVALVLRPWRRWSALTVSSVAWLVLGAVVVLPQRWSQYQREMFLVPLAILAVQGADELWSRLQARRTTPRSRPGQAGLAVTGVAVVAALLFVLPARVLVRHVDQLAHHGFALSASDRTAFRRETGDYREIGDDLAAIGPLPGAPHAPIYVLGHPLVYELLDRDQAIALNGWGPEQWIDAQRRQFHDELNCARPRIAFVDNFSRTTLRSGSPDSWRFFNQLYATVKASGDTHGYGLTLYELRPDAGPRPASCPAG